MKVQVEFQEPDRKKRIKRIIAREGLVFFPFIAILGYNLQRTLTYRHDWLHTKPEAAAFGGGQLAFEYYLAYKDYLSRTYFILAAYGIYLFIRFIIWAVRTLRDGK